MPLAIPSGLVNPVALAGALLLVPLILLYLLKPKPKRIKFPTLMFIKRLEEAKRFSSFINRFIRDPLLLMQIAMILLLTLAIANPYALVEKTKAEDQAIAIVIDGSASMLAIDVNPSRFEAAVSEAKEVLYSIGEGSEVSLVVAENIPITVLSNGNIGRALDLLGRLECGDTPSNTGDALILAKDLLSQSNLKKTAYLISDFSRSESDPLAGRRILEMNGIDVQFIRLNGEGSNVGIVDIEAKREPMNRNTLYLTYTVRNYDDIAREITRKVYINDVVDSVGTSTIGPHSDELFYVNSTITYDRQLIAVELSGGGMLGVDDKAYAVVPWLETYKTMLLTSADRDKYVSYAIEAQSNNLLRTVEPPIIPTLKDFDCIVIGNVEKDSILPGTFRDIKNFVASGDSLIVIASEDLRRIDDQNFHELMPVTLDEMLVLERNINTLDHEILKDVLVENVVVKRYYTAEAKENATVIAEIEGNPVIAYWSYGEGKVVYMGINPSKEWSNLHYSSSFPIFWSQLVDYVNRKDDIVRHLDFNTGEYLVFEKEYYIKKPSGVTANSKSIFLDKQGFYTINAENVDERIAVNLVNTDESSIKTAVYEEDSGQTIEVKQETEKEELFKYLLAFAALVLFIETVIYRRRGLV